MGGTPDREESLKELLKTREEVDEVLRAPQKQEEQLHQREQELTTLKGALKEEDLSTLYHEEVKQKEQLKRAKSELEEEKRLLDKSIVKLTKELDQMSQESHNALSELQSQLEEYKERSRREITDSQKHAKDRNAEVEKMQYNWGRLQDEATRLKQALQDSQAERENAMLDKELLALRLHRDGGQAVIPGRSILANQRTGGSYFSTRFHPPPPPSI